MDIQLPYSFVAAVHAVVYNPRWFASVVTGLWLLAVILLAEHRGSSKTLHVTSALVVPPATFLVLAGLMAPLYPAGTMSLNQAFTT